MATGRPTKYEKKYCQQLIEHMAKGFSVESFAGLIGVGKNTLYQWIEAHDEFQDAMHQGVAQSRLFWEKLGHEGIWNEWSGNGGRSFNSQVWAMNMRNRFKWDKDDMEDGPPQKKSKKKFTFTKNKPDSNDDES